MRLQRVDLVPWTAQLGAENLDCGRVCFRAFDLGLTLFLQVVIRAEYKDIQRLTVKASKEKKKTNIECSKFNKSYLKIHEKINFQFLFHLQQKVYV